MGFDNEKYDESEDLTVQGPVFVVHVSRPAEVKHTWKYLSIIMMEQEIMETINYHPSVIISGKTGCGKPTQVPHVSSFCESGFGSNQFSSRSVVIGITQPRRVAPELGVCLDQEVGFQVFCMKVLLLQNDLLLRRYSVIILDEAHVIGMLTRAIKIREELYNDQRTSTIWKHNSIRKRNHLAV
ncbi:RNA helicase family protein [Raphanus sativus]|nr:RNA helicase family protein [Raphanus sativus]